MVLILWVNAFNQLTKELKKIRNKIDKTIIKPDGLFEDCGKARFAIKID